MDLIWGQMYVETTDFLLLVKSQIIKSYLVWDTKGNPYWIDYLNQ